MAKTSAHRARAKTRDNAPGLRVALDVSSFGFAVFDRDLKLVTCNKAFSEMREYPADLCKPGTDIADLYRFNAKRGDYGAGDVEALVKSRLQQTRKFKPYAVEFELSTGRTLSTLYHPIDDNRLLLTSTDVTESKRAETALRQSEARNALVEQAATEGIYEWLIEDSILITSPRIKQIFGLKSSESGATNLNWNERVHADDFERYKDSLRDHFKGLTGTYECEYRVRDEAGRYRWIRDRGVCVRNGAGRAIRLVGAISDVTEHVDRETELTQKSTILESTLENMGQGISMVDADLRVIAFNQKFLELLEFPPDKFKLGYHMREAFRFNAERGEYGPGDVEQQVNERLELARKFDPHQFERVRPDGTVIRIHGSPLPDKQGFVTTYTDITSLKRAEEDLRRQNARLRKEIEAHRRSKATIEYLVDEIKSRHNFEEIVGESDLLNHVLGQLEQVAATDSTVLIQGETGTGKELFVRAIHNLSDRKTQTMVKVNCAALPRELVESELFGHEKGAFTGATEQRKGRFELADKGTIFLDEVGELPAEAQAKLLRVLQEQEFERVGGTQTIGTDVRVIAATNRDLSTEVDHGQFRSDLFYRLSVFPLTVPPLRQRRSDIPMLAEYFLARYARKIGKQFEGIASDSLSALMDYSWPGNIRELENVIERAVILSPGPLLKLMEPLDRLKGADHEAIEPAAMSGTLQEVEAAYINRVLASTRGTIEGDKGAAKILGINPSTLRGRMRKLGIKKPL